MAKNRWDQLGNIDRIGDIVGYGHLFGFPFGNPKGVTANATTGVPVNGKAGYAKGAFFFNVISGTTYINTGTLASATWSQIPVSGSTVAALTVTALTATTLTTPALVETGTETVAIGASTVALGTNFATAATLPAATAKVYPTTAADDTVGVAIHANDKVTGRSLFIGNGVSNKILKVYGPSGAVINGAAGDAAFSSVSGKGVTIVCLSGAGNTWLAA